MIKFLVGLNNLYLKWKYRNIMLTRDQFCRSEYILLLTSDLVLASYDSDYKIEYAEYYSENGPIIVLEKILLN